MTVSLQQAQLKLAELIHQATPGDRITIEDQGKVVASLHVEEPKKIRRAGSLKGKIKFVGDPFDKSHLEDFREYME